MAIDDELEQFFRMIITPATYFRHSMELLNAHGTYMDALKKIKLRNKQGGEDGRRKSKEEKKKDKKGWFLHQEIPPEEKRALARMAEGLEPKRAGPFPYFPTADSYKHARAMRNEHMEGIAVFLEEAGNILKQLSGNREGIFTPHYVRTEAEKLDLLAAWAERHDAALPEKGQIKRYLNPPASLRDDLANAPLDMIVYLNEQPARAPEAMALIVRNKSGRRVASKMAENMVNIREAYERLSAKYRKAALDEEGLARLAQELLIATDGELKPIRVKDRSVSDCYAGTLIGLREKPDYKFLFTRAGFEPLECTEGTATFQRGSREQTEHDVDRLKIMQVRETGSLKEAYVFDWHVTDLRTFVELQYDAKYAHQLIVLNHEKGLEHGKHGQVYKRLRSQIEGFLETCRIPRIDHTPAADHRTMDIGIFDFRTMEPERREAALQESYKDVLSQLGYLPKDVDRLLKLVFNEPSFPSVKRRHHLKEAQHRLMKELSRLHGSDLGGITEVLDLPTYRLAVAHVDFLVDIVEEGPQAVFDYYDDPSLPPVVLKDEVDNIIKRATFLLELRALLCGREQRDMLRQEEEVLTEYKENINRLLSDQQRFYGTMPAMKVQAGRTDKEIAKECRRGIEAFDQANLAIRGRHTRYAPLVSLKFNTRVRMAVSAFQFLRESMREIGRDGQRDSRFYTDMKGFRNRIDSDVVPAQYILTREIDQSYSRERDLIDRVLE